jgi:hypothetical protein
VRRQLANATPTHVNGDTYYHETSSFRFEHLYPSGFTAFVPPIDSVVQVTRELEKDGDSGDGYFGRYLLTDL